MTPDIVIVSRCHEGLVRVRNEDCVWTGSTASGHAAAVVADGMGGLMSGDLASEVAVHSARRQLQGTDLSLEEVVLEAGTRVTEAAADRGQQGQMGTTLLVWRSCADGAEFAHVGDSRLYTWHREELQQVSVDHSVTQRLLNMGQITPQQAMFHDQRHVLTQALGLEHYLQPQCGRLPLVERTLLCSDGLSDMVGPAKLADLLATQDPQMCAAELLKAALDEGGRDNVSLVLIDDPRASGQ